MRDCGRVIFLLLLPQFTLFDLFLPRLLRYTPTGGASTHAILSSVLVTCRQHSIPILDYLVQLQRFGGNPPPLVSAIPLQLEAPSLPSAQR